ncbi:Ger(x)C family spore germination protein [Bacillaceae bacterium IKA-2]|nr:Ger(x)C family spore germination protein [Bacillaceae bacterium IKA-2]
MRKVIIAILSLLLLTSCWDLTEIEEIGFVLAVAIDPLSEEELAEYKKQYKKETGQKARQMYKTSYQVVIPSMIVEEGAKLEDKAFFNIKTVGSTNFKMARITSARISRRLNFQQLKVIIIDEHLLKTGDLAKFIDFYIRDHEMNRDTLVYVSKGGASEVLETKLPLESMVALSIKKIQDHYLQQHSMPAPKRIGEMATSVLDESSFIVPRIAAVGKELIMAGAAVILGGKNEMIGWLGEVDVMAHRLIVGEAKNLVIEGKVNEQLFDFEVDNFDSEINYQLKEGQDFFEINLRAEGFFVENWLDDLAIGEEETNKKLEAALEKEIERLATEFVEKMQSEFQVDIFELGKIVKKKNYHRWKEMKENWDGEDGYFSKANIEINAEVKIRHQMIIEQLG